MRNERRFVLNACVFDFSTRVISAMERLGVASCSSSMSGYCRWQHQHQRLRTAGSTVVMFVNESNDDAPLCRFSYSESLAYEYPSC